MYALAFINNTGKAVLALSKYLKRTENTPTSRFRSEFLTTKITTGMKKIKTDDRPTIQPP
jgi:hypothetical protein